MPGWPDRSAGSYVDWVADAPDFDASAFDPMLAGTDFTTEEQLQEWEHYLTLRHARPVFVVLSPRMEIVNAYRGFYAEDALANLREALDLRVRWSRVLDHEGIEVFRFVPPGTEESDAALWEVS
ncbi:hypothetical protein [Nocardioides alcanivorans]|uniref:hypothetical protein n=1 Tax=Nocardioides alcanivorans TaxID=2897352 RepID=UPI001F1BB5A3|nr:hypothetical protein [Nocardioides alcanivorans]